MAVVARPVVGMSLLLMGACTVVWVSGEQSILLIEPSGLKLSFQKPWPMAPPVYPSPTEDISSVCRRVLQGLTRCDGGSVSLVEEF